MKKTHIYKLFTLLTIYSVIMFSCSASKLIEPDACLRVYIYGEDEVYTETNSIVLGETVYFAICSNADHYSIFPGDEGQVYGEEGATGLAINESDYLAYEFKTAGSYIITLVATNVDNEGGDFLRTITTKTLKVTE